MLHLGARLGLRSQAAMGLRRLELGAMLQHGEHNDGEPARERNPRLAHRRSPGDVECPVFERETAAVAGQHHIGGLIGVTARFVQNRTLRTIGVSSRFVIFCTAI
jgi:hypothetical protein